jgi:GTP cyclohydrolase I
MKKPKLTYNEEYFYTAGANLLAGAKEAHNGVKETPMRFARGMSELLKGYTDDPKKHVKIFEDVRSSSMILTGPVSFVSLCEHHLLPFMGTAYLGYIPKQGVNKVLGISKLVRIFECFSKRIQVQERIGEQFVEFMDAEVQNDGVICVISATHLCISARGVKASGTKMTTSAIRGAFIEPVVRDEFFKLIELSKG